MGCTQSPKERFRAQNNMNIAKAQIQSKKQEYGGICTMGIVVNKTKWVIQELQVSNESGEMIIAPPERINPGEYAPFFHRKCRTRSCHGSVGSITYNLLHNESGGKTQIEIYWDTPYYDKDNEIGGELIGNTDIDVSVLASPYFVADGENEGTVGRYVWIIE